MKTSIRVLYNAECPICNFEIKHYQKYTNNKKIPIQFDDLNSSDLAHWNITADLAARRLHVDLEGEVKVGMEGFLALWNTMPKYRWLFHIFRQPVIKQISSFLYDYILAPYIYFLHLRRKKNITRRNQ